MNKNQSTGARSTSKRSCQRTEKSSMPSPAPKHPRSQSGNRANKSSRMDEMMRMLEDGSPASSLSPKTPNSISTQAGTDKCGNTELDDYLMYMRRLAIEQGMPGDTFDAWLYRTGAVFRELRWRRWTDVDVRAFEAWYWECLPSAVDMIEDEAIRTPRFLGEMRFIIKTLLNDGLVTTHARASMLSLLNSIQHLTQTESNAMSSLPEW